VVVDPVGVRETFVVVSFMVCLGEIYFGMSPRFIFANKNIRMTAKSHVYISTLKGK
jgi:hypothetical protein